LYLDSQTQDNTDNDNDGVHNDSANGFAGGAPGAANPQAAYMNVGVRSAYTMQAFQGSRLLPTDAGNINTMGDEVVCSDAVTGAQRWSVKLEGDLKKVGGSLAAPPAEVGGKLFITTLKGKILVVEPATGTTSRTFEVGSPVRAQPVVHDGWIYVGTVDGQLVAIDTGERRWTGWSHWGGNAQRTGKQG
jgi:outer membrane protein assembly factor BamB